MPNSLVEANSRYLSRIARLSRACTAFHAVRPTRDVSERWAAQEGLLSAIWQTWCGFCRDVILLSCTGTTTQSGTAVTSPFSHHAEAEIRFIAQCLAQSGMPRRIRPISGMYAEPTWGDTSKIAKILTGLVPSNQASLSTAFGSIVIAKDLQTVRNTCSHINAETMTTLNSIRVRYDDNKFRHPSDAMFWIDPVTKKWAYEAWIAEMGVAARFAIA